VARSSHALPHTHRLRVLPREIRHPPRSFAEQVFNIQRWTEMPRGGHFAALEAPELLAADVTTFFRALRGR
jgi:pimeloyl-ACP methyl ester carboxylesterase